MKDNFEKTGMASSISKFADWSKETFITLAKMGEKPLTRGEIDDIILTTQRTEQAASAGARVARTVVRFASKKIFKDNEGRVFVAIASASGTKIFYKSTGKSIPGRAEKGIWTVMNGITLKSAQDGYWIFYIKDPGKILTPPLKKISDALTKMELDNGAIIANNAIEFGTVQRVTYRDLQNIAKFNNWVEEVGAITQAAKQTGMGLIGTSVGPTVRQAFADISTI